MVSEDIPGGLVLIEEYKRKKLAENIRRMESSRRQFQESMGKSTDVEALYVRLEELENRFMNLVEYTQDLYLVAKQQEEELLITANRIEFLVNALGKLTVWTGYPK
jgi:hypothetical protein